MVMATHDLNFAASVCDTLVLMKAGRIIGHGPIANVMTAAHVRELYGVDVEVLFDRQAGHLMVVGSRRAQ
jgi:iron complex transport system ATP-binding protein